MASTISHAGALPVVVLARMAGQYAKPRSKPIEIRDGARLPSYRGEAVNGRDFTVAARTPDPFRMLRAYGASAATMNVVRGLAAAAQAPWGGPDLFVSHEGLLLDYETPLTRVEPRTQLRYACSGHLLWAGERTRDPYGAHIDYLAGIRNPIAVKIGPTATPDDMLALGRVP